jgi:hypothetical protein
MLLMLLPGDIALLVYAMVPTFMKAEMPSLHSAESAKAAG